MLARYAITAILFTVPIVLPPPLPAQEAEAIPDSATPARVLAGSQALAAAGEREEAIRNYERALELDPGNENATLKLKELRGS